MKKKKGEKNVNKKDFFKKFSFFLWSLPFNRIKHICKLFVSVSFYIKIYISEQFPPIPWLV